MLLWMLLNVPGFDRLYYRFRCPHPIGDYTSTRDCVKGGFCGCNNRK